VRIGILGARGFPSNYGGFETLLRRLAPALAAAGHEVSVYCRSAQVAKEPAERLHGVRQIFTPALHTTSLSTLSHGAVSSVDAARRHFDSVLVLNVANGFYLPLLHRGGASTAINVDGLEWERDKWGPTGKATFRRAAALTARWAERVIVDSEAIGRVWREEFGREVTYIPYGADIVGRRPVDRIERLGLEPSQYVLCVARLVPENNVGLLLDAAAMLPPSMRVVVVGSGKAGAPLDDRLGATRSTASNITWLGHVDDQELLTDLWANAGVYVHGHSVGGTNPALLQAMGAGCPVLAFDSPFNAEVLGAESQLYRYSARDLADSIEKLLADDELRSIISERQLDIVRERYSWDDVCRRYEQVLASGC
jgi:glycosyltransferase involved in cell wall biosynthesis